MALPLNTVGWVPDVGNKWMRHVLPTSAEMILREGGHGTGDQVTPRPVIPYINLKTGSKLRTFAQLDIARRRAKLGKCGQTCQRHFLDTDGPARAPSSQHSLVQYRRVKHAWAFKTTHAPLTQHKECALGRLQHKRTKKTRTFRE